MSQITRCPNCATSFRVTDQQLAAHQGKVRCGKCAFVFNALNCLVDAEAMPAAPATIAAKAAERPEPASPAAAPPARAASAPATADSPAPPAPTARPAAASLPAGMTATPAAEQVATADKAEARAPSRDAASAAVARPITPATPPAPAKPPLRQSATTQAASHQPLPGSRKPVLPELPAKPDRTPAAQPTHDAPTDPASEAPPRVRAEPAYNPIRLPEDEALFHPQPKPRGSWLWSVGAGLALAVLLVQAAFLMRQPLTMSYPMLRPYFVDWCQRLQCSMPLPREAEKLKLEYSELNYVPDNPNLIQLTATLRNHAQFEQDLPLMELTLTDENQRVVVKRIFKPQEYLAPGEKQRQSLQAADELHAFLQLDLGDARSTNYSLFWFYN